MKRLKIYIVGAVACVCMLFCMSFMYVCQRCYAMETSEAMEEIDDKKSNCDIVFLLDVSGSMKFTDSNKVSIEIMKMMTDVCSEQGNQVGFVGYNDTVAYKYPLTDVSSSKKRNAMKKYMGKISFYGETDIGLGLKTAVSMLENRKNTNRTPIICMLSDGKTDLRKSHTGRTEKQSEKDVTSSIKVAQEQGIKIYTVGMSNRFNEIVDYLEVISKQTEAESYHATSPFELLEIVNGILGDYEQASLVNQETCLSTGKMEKYKLQLPNCSLEKYRVVLFSSAKIQDAGLLEQKNTSKIIGYSKYYTILEIDKPQGQEVTLYYKVSKGASVSINTQSVFFFEGVLQQEDSLSVGGLGKMKFFFMDAKTKENVSSEKEFQDLECKFYIQDEQEKTELSSKILQAGYELSLTPTKAGVYTIVVEYKGKWGSGSFVSKNFEILEKTIKAIDEMQVVLAVDSKKTFSLEELFDSKLKNEFVFSIMPSGNEKTVDCVLATIQDDVVEITGREVGDSKIAVIAESGTVKYQVTIDVQVKTFWKVYQNRIIAILLVSLIGFTILIYGIVYFRQKRKRNAALERKFQGFLLGYFNDLKSSNDIPMMEWDLRDFPGVGVTLNTLLKECNISDYFLGAERIWIYPGNEECITIVHNLNGSIFVGNKLIDKNTPMDIYHGDVIYVCFEENGAEVEIRYRNSGGIIYDRSYG